MRTRAASDSHPWTADVLRALVLLRDEEDGQSLIELALFIPIFTLLLVYAVDFGYFFLVAASLSSASRNAIEYSIQGSSSPSQSTVPAVASVSTLAIASIGLAGASTSTVTVRVCSSAAGVNAANNSAKCATPSNGAGTTMTALDTDPESPAFQLNRIDIAYTINLPIPIPSAVFPNRTFHRMAEMRQVQ